jgi:general secretion pathway protein E
MRIFDPEVLLKSFEELGLRGSDDERWQNIIEQGTGIVLVTGPTGSGKTTTLYSTLRQLANTDVNVCTIEDPIEMVEPAFNQMQVNTTIELDFASGVRALMRQDPDIIMVGEIRDLETANMAIQAALTGHLVLSTLHTNDSPSAISRLVELGVPAFLIRATVRGVMSQRLVRTLCSHCKQLQPTDIDGWQSLVGDYPVAMPEALYRPVGCKACRDTGYRGREGIYEVLVADAGVQNVITDSHDIRQIRERAVVAGMMPLRVAGAEKIARGETTLEEVMRVAPALDD